jgi:hypothetical protein
MPSGWNTFQKQHRGSGMNKQQLSRMYQQQKGGGLPLPVIALDNIRDHLGTVKELLTFAHVDRTSYVEAWKQLAMY